MSAISNLISISYLGIFFNRLLLENLILSRKGYLPIGPLMSTSFWLTIKLSNLKERESRLPLWGGIVGFLKVWIKENWLQKKERDLKKEGLRRSESKISRFSTAHLPRKCTARHQKKGKGTYQLWTQQESIKN